MRMSQIGKSSQICLNAVASNVRRAALTYACFILLAFPQLLQDVFTESPRNRLKCGNSETHRSNKFRSGIFDCLARKPPKVKLGIWVVTKGQYKQHPLGG